MPPKIVEFGDFTHRDLRELPNTISIVRQVARTHFGVGLRIAFLKAIDICNLGVLLYGGKGTAKTTAIEGLRTLAHKRVIDWDFKTIASLGKTPKFQKELRHSFITWLSADFSRNSHEVNHSMLKLISALISEHRLTGDSFVSSANVRDAVISWFGACDYNFFHTICGYETWEGNIRDRIFTYFCFLPPIERINRNIPKPRIVLNFPQLEDVELSNDSIYHNMRDLLRWHFTSNRSKDYAERLLKASAAMNMRTYVTEADYKWLSLCSCNFVVVNSMFAMRASLASPISVDCDAIKLFWHCIEEDGVNIDSYAKLESVGRGEIIRIANNYQDIFWIRENRCKISEDIWQRLICPQFDFEYGMLHEGKKYYRGFG